MAFTHADVLQCTCQACAPATWMPPPCACRLDAHFEDPLMDVATPREIHLAFYSLIKLFKAVETEQKSLTWNAEPLLPSYIKPEEVQQVRWGRSPSLYNDVWRVQLLESHCERRVEEEVQHMRV